MIDRNIPFQRRAIDGLKRKSTICMNLGIDEILFTAPVGSGKTIVSGLFMDEYEILEKELCFIWISPGTGGLAEQSKKSIESFSKNIKCIDIDTLLLNREIKDRDAIFINWESVNRKEKNISRRGGEKISLDQIFNNSNLTKIILIDEAHVVSDTYISSEIVDMINPDLVIRITATPQNLLSNFNNANTVEIELDEVIDYGLIKNQTLVNHNIKSLNKKNIIKEAIKKRNEIESEFDKLVDEGLRNYNPTPLVLIQIANDNLSLKKDANIEISNAEEIRQMLISEGVDNNKIGIWLSEAKNCQNINNIKYSDVEFLIFKQAIAIGWDAPRSHILVRLRETSSPIFDIQTIGRILRTTERKLYGNTLVDSAYIYTEYTDLEYRFNLTEDMNKRISLEKNKANLKKDFLYKFGDISIPMYKRKRKYEYEVDTKLLFKMLNKKFENSLLNNIKIRESELIRKLNSYIGKTKDIYNIEFFDVANTLNIEKDNYVLAKEYNYELKNIYPRYNLTRFITSILSKHIDYDGTSEFIHKLYISNKLQINGTIKDVIYDYEKNLIPEYEEEHRYNFIETVYYSGGTKEASEVYAYDKEPNLSVKVTKSKSEERFASFLNENKNIIKYWFKNGENGDHFSVTYQVMENNIRLVREYYPDFIIIDNNKKLWILDTKAPDNNSDFKYVKEKYEAGKKYEKYFNKLIQKNTIKYFTDIEFSIIKYKSLEPYICINNNYSEDTNDPRYWISFKDIIKDII